MWSLPLISEDGALHLTGGLSFYFSTAAANPWDQAKANTDAGLIYLGEGGRSLRRQTSLLPCRKCGPQSTPPFLGARAAFENIPFKVSPPFLTKHDRSPLYTQCERRNSPHPTLQYQGRAYTRVSWHRLPGSNSGHLLAGDLGRKSYSISL